jgi:hypothetical protein
LIAVLVILVECPHCGGDFDEGDGKGSLQRHMAAVKAIETRERDSSIDDDSDVDTTKINEKIIKKIHELTKNKTDRDFCEKILDKELRFSSEEGDWFKDQFKHLLAKTFPYEGSK